MSDFVDTNIGSIPVEDYFNIIALQHGFDSYEDLVLHGFVVDLPEDSS